MPDSADAFVTRFCNLQPLPLSGCGHGLSVHLADIAKMLPTHFLGREPISVFFSSSFLVFKKTFMTRSMSFGMEAGLFRVGCLQQPPHFYMTLLANTNKHTCGNDCE